MNRILLSLCMMLLATAWGHAETVSPYTQDFTNVDATEEGFAPSGWTHIVGESYYSNISWSNGNDATTGRFIEVEYQATSSNTNPDVLISPAVTGEVSFKVKSTTGYSWQKPSLTLFKYTKGDNGSFTRGDTLKTTMATLTSDWQTVTVNVDSNTYIGFFGSYIGLDDFTAASAEIVKKSAMKIESADIVGDALQQPDGTWKVTAEVTVKNTGDLDIPSWDMSLINSYGTTTYSTVTCNTTLAVGATSDKLTLVFTIDKLESTTSFYIKEGVTGTSTYLARPSLKKYEVDFSLKESESAYGKLSSPVSVSFGSLKTDATKTYYLYNDGAKPLIFDVVTVPENFKVDIASGDTLQPQSHRALNITALTSAFGSHSGNLELKSTEENIDFTLALSSLALDPTKYYEDFEGGAMPANITAESAWSVTQPYGGGSYYASNSSSTEASLVTPKLDFTDGETFALAARSYYKTYYTPVLKVSYSATREDAGTEVAVDLSAVNDDSWTTIAAAIPAGSWFIHLTGDRIYLDEFYGGVISKDVDPEVQLSATIPSTGDVNSDITVSGSAKNVGKDFKAGEYTISLIAGDETIGSVDNTADWKVGESRDLSFTWTPRTAATVKAYVVVKAGDYSVSSDTVSIVIAAETAGGTTQVGTKREMIHTAPIQADESKSEAISIYPADKVGIAPGSVITKITWRGYNSYEAKAHMKVWIGETDKTTPASELATDNDSLILDADVNFPVAGNRNESADVLVIKLPKPYIYQGGNLIIQSQNKKLSSSYHSVYFDGDPSIGTTRYYNSDNRRYRTAESTPVIIIETKKEPSVLSGVITNDGTPQPGATLTLASGNVRYNATADSEGKYAVTVYKDFLDYTITLASADGSATRTSVVNLQGKDRTWNMDLSTLSSEVTITVGDAGYATLYYGDYDLTVPADAEAHTYSIVSDTANGDVLTNSHTYASGDIVPRGTAVLVKAAAGDYTFVVAPDAAEAYADDSNILRGTDVAATTEGGKYYYFFANDSEGPGFYWGAENGGAFTCKAHKAYIAFTPKADTKAKPFLALDGVATGIGSVKSEKSGIISQNGIYNLAGQKVSGSYKGIVIVNGKKYIQR